MDDIPSNLGETHPKTCPLYRNIGYHLLQKWQNKLTGRTKYFPTFCWPKKDVAKRTAKIQYLLAVAIALYSGIDSWERSELSGEFNGTDFLYIYISMFQAVVGGWSVPLGQLFPRTVDPKYGGSPPRVGGSRMHARYDHSLLHVSSCGRR